MIRREDYRYSNGTDVRAAEKPFKTALRTVYNAESVIVKLTFDNGLTGWGGAADGCHYRRQHGWY